MYIFSIKRSLPLVMFVTIAVKIPLHVSCFTATIWHETATHRTVPSKTEGVEIELPNFDELFNRIQQVSPLARLAMEGGTGGFANADYTSTYNFLY